MQDRSHAVGTIIIKRSIPGNVGRYGDEGNRHRRTLLYPGTDTTACEKRHQAESRSAKQAIHKSLLIFRM
jgi:hypothetical protein